MPKKRQRKRLTIRTTQHGKNKAQPNLRRGTSSVRRQITNAKYYVKQVVNSTKCESTKCDSTVYMKDQSKSDPTNCDVKQGKNKSKCEPTVYMKDQSKCDKTMSDDSLSDDF